MEDLRTIKQNAWSLSPNEDTSGLKLIFEEETKYGVFKYFRDVTTGEYRYQSSGTEKFNNEMKSREKERKACLRKSRD